MKYDALEEMRFILIDLNDNNNSTFTKAKSVLKENTWDAFVDANKIWNPTPNKNVVWGGLDSQLCTLLSSHKSHNELKKLGFTKCYYDNHGSPNFDKVTFPSSVVKIADLYSEYSCEELNKRGGSRHSFQEVAQERIYQRLKPVIEAWAKENNFTPDYYKWRDAHDLVPHEDTNCQTMRLVYRSAHKAFTHRGGIANMINIKSHFG